MVEEVKKDSILAKIIKELKLDSDCHQHYNRARHSKWRLVSSSNSLSILKLVHEQHATPFGGHSGICRTFNHFMVGLGKCHQICGKMSSVLEE